MEDVKDDVEDTGLALLSPTQLRFIEAYVEHLDSNRAAMICGYPGARAHEVARVMMMDEDVTAEIERRLIRKGEHAGVTQAAIVRELAGVAFFDLRRCFDEEGRVRLPHDLDGESARALAQYEVVTTVKRKGEDDEEVTTVKVKGAGKIDALKLLGKHVGMFADNKKVEIVGNGFTFNAVLTGEKPPGQDEFEATVDELAPVKA